MGVNKTIIVSVIIIMASGLYTVLLSKQHASGLAGAAQNAAHPDQTRSKTVTRVVVGAYLLGIVVSVVDLLGGPFGHVAGMMLLVAVATALYAIIPDIAQRMGQHNTGGGGGGSSGFR